VSEKIDFTYASNTCELNYVSTHGFGKLLSLLMFVFIIVLGNQKYMTKIEYSRIINFIPFKILDKYYKLLKMLSILSST